MLRCLRIILLTTLHLVSITALRAEEGFFDSRGVRIRYRVEGTGEPVVLVHGFTASVEANWGLPGVLRALSADHQVIALDCRGHGRSEKPHDPQKYGLEMVEDIVRLLDHLKIRKAHVVGYSMGGMITAKLLTTHPDRILTATLGGSGGLRSRPGSLLFFENLARSLEDGKEIGPLMNLLTPSGQPQPTEEQVRNTGRMLAATNDTKALAAVVRGWKHLAMDEEKLKTTKIPVLALIGSRDPLKRGVDELKSLLPGLKVVVIEGAGHMTAPARPEFLQGLKDFLAQHRQRAAGADRAAGGRWNADRRGSPR